MKYADSEYIELVDEIMREIKENTDLEDEILVKDIELYLSELGMATLTYNSHHRRSM